MEQKIIKIYRLRRSFKRLLKARANRIKQTKLRIWIEKNEEINVFNYWPLRLLNYKNWKQIEVK